MTAIPSTPQASRVAYLFPQGDLGGAEIATLRILEAHDRARWSPLALCWQDGAVAARCRAAGVPVAVAPRRPRLRDRAELRAARGWLAEVLRDSGARVMHAVGAWMHAVAWPAGRGGLVASVWFQHGIPELSDPIDWIASLRPARAIVVNSRATERVQRRRNLRRIPIERIPPPVSGIVCSTMVVPRVRAALGAAPGDVLVTVAGRLQRGKGQDVAIRALARVAPRCPSLRLAIAGEALFAREPGARERLEELARRLGVVDRVRFLGTRDDLEAVYAASDVIAAPSRLPEGHGLVVAEALAAGRAVVASDWPALREQIDPGRTGILVPPGDPAALAAALEALARDGGLRRRLGEAARGLPHVLPREAARRIESLYDRLVAPAALRARTSS